MTNHPSPTHTNGHGRPAPPEQLARPGYLQPQYHQLGFAEIRKAVSGLSHPHDKSIWSALTVWAGNQGLPYLPLEPDLLVRDYTAELVRRAETGADSVSRLRMEMYRLNAAFADLYQVPKAFDPDALPDDTTVEAPVQPASAQPNARQGESVFVRIPRLVRQAHQGATPADLLLRRVYEVLQGLEQEGHTLSVAVGLLMLHFGVSPREIAGINLRQWQHTAQLSNSVVVPESRARLAGRKDPGACAKKKSGRSPSPPRTVQLDSTRRAALAMLADLLPNPDLSALSSDERAVAMRAITRALQSAGVQEPAAAVLRALHLNARYREITDHTAPRFTKKCFVSAEADARARDILRVEYCNGRVRHLDPLIGPPPAKAGAVTQARRARPSRPAATAPAATGVEPAPAAPMAPAAEPAGTPPPPQASAPQPVAPPAGGARQVQYSDGKLTIEVELPLAMAIEVLKLVENERRSTDGLVVDLRQMTGDTASVLLTTIVPLGIAAAGKVMAALPSADAASARRPEEGAP